jgi:hypothetical protein
MRVVLDTYSRSRKDKQRPKTVGEAELFLKDEMFFLEGCDTTLQCVIGKNVLSGSHEALYL